MGRGGSRVGAGRPGWLVKAEHCRSIDVRRFAALGVLKPGSWGWEWRDPETMEQRASIGVLAASTGLRLHYALNGEPMSQDVSLTRTGCGFGGDRPWFLCPRCGRRVAVLYMRASGFACRHCQKVTYASQCTDAIGRTWIKQQKLERRLGKHWARPPNMHAATHRRIVRAILACEEVRDIALSRYLTHVLPKLATAARRAERATLRRSG